MVQEDSVHLLKMKTVHDFSIVLQSQCFLLTTKKRSIITTPSGPSSQIVGIGIKKITNGPWKDARYGHSKTSVFALSSVPQDAPFTMLYFHLSLSYCVILTTLYMYNFVTVLLKHALFGVSNVQNENIFKKAFIRGTVRYVIKQVSKNCMSDEMYILRGNKKENITKVKLEDSQFLEKQH